MTEDQRQRVESLFHAVLALPEHEREPFLASACADDPVVCAEVLSLCSNYVQGEKFLAGITFSDLGISEEEIAALQPGARLGRYSIVALLGRGGMGEVYLAQDQRLKRKVAIKILPASFSADPALIERLRREAQAASALNHPNILTIHEFSQEGEQHYIVSEFVEGTSLRDLIGKIAHEQALEYARQIGQALSAAHAAGIIHRDIKPENIIVRNDGFIRVLDFGLAKVAAVPVEAAIHGVSGMSDPLVTQTGTLMGTVNYMSPEQARGEKVSERTDIWSWGVVLYEMLTGKRPFDTSSVAELHAAHAAAIGPASRDKRVNRLLARAMAVDLKQRYSTMAEALEDLSHVQKASFRRYVRRVIRSFAFQDGRVPWTQWAALVIFLGLVGFGVYEVINRPHKYTISSSKQVTTSGNIVTATISPKSKFIFYATQEANGQALRSIDLENNVYSQLISSQAVEYSGISILPSDAIYYVTRKNGRGTLYKLSLGGDSEGPFSDHIDSPVTFSPDEKRVAFLRNDSPSKTTTLIVHDLINKEETALMVLHWPDSFQPNSLLWGPDAGSLLFAVVTYDPSAHFKIESVSTKTGKVTKAIEKPWIWAGKPAWLDHGRAIALAVEELGSNRAQIKQMNWPNGSESQMMTDTMDYRDLSITSDAKGIVTWQLRRESMLWVGPVADMGKAHLIETRGGRFYGVSWTPSGKIISQTEINSRPALWAIDPNSGEDYPITSRPYLYQQAVVSPDGKYLVYVSNQDGVDHLWRSDLDGKNAMRLTSSASGEETPSFGPGGKWIAYTSQTEGFSLWKVPITGGIPSKLIEHQASTPVISPDGRLIACEYPWDDSHVWTVVLLDSTGRLIRSFSNIPAGRDAMPVRWTLDGQHLLYVSDSGTQVSNLWIQRVDGGNPKQITHFTDDSIFSFALSPDGKTVGFVRGKYVSDVVLMQTTN